MSETLITQKHESEIPLKFTRRGKIALAALGFSAAIGVGHGLLEANDSDFKGTQIVEIDGSTTNLTDIAQHVEGVEGHVGSTINKIVEMNPEVFQDRGENKSSAYVESQDIGQDVIIPKSVD
jgi:hypothetical protein